MKIKAKDVIMAVVVAAIILVIVVFGFPDTGETDDSVKANITIDFIDATPSLYPGNLTTWTYDDGEWNAVSVNNSGHTVWVFEDVPSDSNCYDQLLAVADIGGFEVSSESQPLGTFVKIINGVENENPGAGWQYYVNDVYANRACNIVTVANGDEVIWKFQESQTS
jgi:hypothetical protein